jgi:hypothetical protein
VFGFQGQSLWLSEGAAIALVLLLCALVVWSHHGLSLRPLVWAIRDARALLPATTDTNARRSAPTPILPRPYRRLAARPHRPSVRRARAA